MAEAISHPSWNRRALPRSNAMRKARGPSLRINFQNRSRAAKSASERPPYSDASSAISYLRITTRPDPEIESSSLLSGRRGLRTSLFGRKIHKNHYVSHSYQGIRKPSISKRPLTSLKILGMRVSSASISGLSGPPDAGFCFRARSSYPRSATSIESRTSRVSETAARYCRSHRGRAQKPREAQMKLDNPPPMAVVMS